MPVQKNYKTKTLVSTGTPLDADEITVIYDGFEYHWSKYSSMISPISYGATIQNINTIDWTEFEKPIAITAGLGGAINLHYPSSSMPLSHTIEIYAMNEIDKQPVWKKIGGGSSPSGELLYEATLDNWFENQGIYVEMDFIDKLFPNDITVEWDGTMYQCTYNEDFSTWGATPTDQGIDWSTYPFVFGIDTANMEIQVGSPTDGTHTIKVYGVAPEPILVTIYDGSFAADHQQMNAYYYSVLIQDMDFTKLKTNKIYVTFDNTEYTFNNTGEDEWERIFGAPFPGYEDNFDFSTYPICIQYDVEQGFVRFYVVDTDSHYLTIQRYV